MRYNTFRNNMNQGTFLNELDARNSEKVRKLLQKLFAHWFYLLSNKLKSNQTMILI